MNNQEYNEFVNEFYQILLNISQGYTSSQLPEETDLTQMSLCFAASAQLFAVLLKAMIDCTKDNDTYLNIFFQNYKEILMELLGMEDLKRLVDFINPENETRVLH